MLMLCATVFAFAPSVGAATQYSGTPDPSGFFAHCNYNSRRVGGATSSNKGISCQYGRNNTSGQFIAGAQITSLSIAYNLSAATSNCNTGTIPNTDTETFTATGTNPATVDADGIAQWSLSSGTDCTGTMTMAVTSCTVTISGSVASSASCKVDALTFSSALPAIPSTPYPGGEVGGSLPSPCFTYSPSSPQANTPVAFDASCSKNASTGGGSTYAWTFASGTATDTVGPNGAATWTANGSYLVTLTITKSGTGYSYQQTVVVGSNGDSSDCPTGWGLINPTAVTKILQCLFVPTSSPTTRMSTFTSAISTKWPLGPVTWMVGLITGPIGDFTTAASPDTILGPDTACSGAPLSSCSLSFDFPLNAGTGGTDHVTVPVFSGNVGNVANAHLGTAMTFTKWVSRLFALVFAFGMIRRIVGFVTGSSMESKEEASAGAG
jgi:hypothetical protein